MDSNFVHLSGPLLAGLGWGWNQADSLRSFDKLRTVSGVEPLAGEG